MKSLKEVTGQIVSVVWQLLSTIFSPLLGKSFSMITFFVANEYTANVIYCSPQLCIFIERINTRFLHVFM
jgi:hypothetical protein